MDSASDRWVDLRWTALPVAAVHAFLTHDEAGGTAVFVGTTRRWTGDVETLGLDYDAYSEMALDSLHGLVEDAFRRWTPLRVAVLHRLGEVMPSEASVVVGVATPHRAEAFDACRWLIDTLKTDVPIWKREMVASPSDSLWR